MIFAREQPKVRHIPHESYFLHPLSRTFHGRDVFSPVAAHLACGVTPAKFRQAYRRLSPRVFR